jgi:hypothetical protein
VTAASWLVGGGEPRLSIELPKEHRPIGLKVVQAIASNQRKVVSASAK